MRAFIVQVGFPRVIVPFVALSSVGKAPGFVPAKGSYVAVLTALKVLGRLSSMPALISEGLGLEEEAVANKLISLLDARNLNSYRALFL